jgi:hypothetical protein
MNQIFILFSLDKRIYLEDNKIRISRTVYGSIKRQRGLQKIINRANNACAMADTVYNCSIMIVSQGRRGR